MRVAVAGTGRRRKSIEVILHNRRFWSSFCEGHGVFPVFCSQSYFKQDLSLIGPCLFSSECQDAADKTGITVSVSKL